jgi:hypothetical protein
MTEFVHPSCQAPVVVWIGRAKAYMVELMSSTWTQLSDLRLDVVWSQVKKLLTRAHDEMGLDMGTPETWEGRQPEAEL